MPEQAVWRVKRVTWAIPAPTVAALRAGTRRVGPPLLLGLLAAVLATQLQPRVWRGQAEVYLNLTNVQFAAANSNLSLAAFDDPRSYLEAQAKIARSPRLAARVVQVAGVPGISARKFLRHSSAEPESDSDILLLPVTYRSGAAAVRLTNAYAEEFRRYKHELDTRSLSEALRRIEVRMKKLRARGRAGSLTYYTLGQNRAALQSFDVQLLNTMSVQATDGASSFRPHALRNGLLGGVLGVLLGVAVAVGIAKRRA